MTHYALYLALWYLCFALGVCFGFLAAACEPRPVLMYRNMNDE